MFWYLIVGCLSAVAYELVAHWHKGYKAKKRFNALRLENEKKKEKKKRAFEFFFVEPEDRNQVSHLFVAFIEGLFPDQVVVSSYPVSSCMELVELLKENPGLKKSDYDFVPVCSDKNGEKVAYAKDKNGNKHTIVDGELVWKLKDPSPGFACWEPLLNASE